MKVWETKAKRTKRKTFESIFLSVTVWCKMWTEQQVASTSIDKIRQAKVIDGLFYSEFRLFCSLSISLPSASVSYDFLVFLYFSIASNILYQNGFLFISSHFPACTIKVKNCIFGEIANGKGKEKIHCGAFGEFISFYIFGSHKKPFWKHF